MSFHVPERRRVTTGPLATDDSYGNNGAFELVWRGVTLFIIASDQGGWEHVSVSARSWTPTWDCMVAIKDIFWDAEDAVMQLHPPRSTYVNTHKHCLHLWRPTSAALPLPPSWMVGIPEAAPKAPAQCSNCRYWSEMVARAAGGSPNGNVIEAMCLAPGGEAGSPMRGDYTRASQSCRAWAAGEPIDTPR